MIKSHLSGILGARRISQKDLAQKAGLALNTVGKFYHDWGDMLDRETLDKICSTLGVDVGDLLEWIPKKRRTGPRSPSAPAQGQDQSISDGIDYL